MAFNESQSFFSKITFKKGNRYLQWDHTQYPGLIFRINNLQIDLKQFDSFIVSEYENIAMLNRGVFVATTGSGAYQLGEKANQAGTELIWITKQIFKSNWGVVNCLSADNVNVGGHGVAYVKITNPQNFVINLLSGKSNFTSKNIEDWVFERIKSSIKIVMSKMTVEQLYKERKLLEENLKNEINEDLSKWGLFLDGVLIEGIKIPEDYKSVLQFDSSYKITNAQSALGRQKLKAELELQRLKDQAELEKQSSVLDLEIKKKAIEVDTLARAKESGIDPLKMMQAEAMKTASEKDNFEVKMDISEGKKTSDSAEKTKINNLLEKLEERFILGEISESSYKDLKTKYMDKLSNFE